MAKRVIVIEQQRDGWRLALWAAVPAGRAQFYASPGAVSAWAGASAAENAEIAAGRVAERVADPDFDAGLTLRQKQDAAEALWTEFQAEVNARNSWRRAGSFLDENGAWSMTNNQ